MAPRAESMVTRAIPLPERVVNRFAWAVAALGFALPLAAQRVDVPVLDAPYNVANGLRGPSMAQSLAIGETFYELGHSTIQKAWGEKKKHAAVSVFLFDVFTSFIVAPPGGDAWVHEEFHRAVMGNRDIDSYNDVYKLSIGATSISVSHVADDDLVRLKAMHPADQVRMGEAGVEGEQMLLRRLEMNRFFSGSRANNVALYWLTKIGNNDYVATGGTGYSNDVTDDLNASDGADIPKRDFTGHDFNGWVYDLFKPAEAYTARGVHPSGVGIDRYIAARDLTDEERKYMLRQGKLSRLNFLDLNLLGIDGWKVPGTNGAFMNLTAGHTLTSFGTTIDVNLFFRNGETKLFAVAHRYANGARFFPGLEAQLIDMPMTIAGRSFEASPRVAIWMQPEHQSFRTRESSPGMLGSIRIRPVSSATISSFIELEGKTQGWVAGNVHLDPNFSIRAGGSIRLR